MDIVLPKFHAPHKLLTPWWDVVIDYFTVAMMSISVTVFGLQTTKDQLICIPVVNCSALARNESVLWAPNTATFKLNVCSQPSCQELKEGQTSTALLTTMADRRQYDYVDSECYSKLPYFTAFFSIIFIGEALVLLVTTRYWYPAIGHLESLLVEFLNHGELLLHAFPNKIKHTVNGEEMNPEVNGEEKKPEAAKFYQKLLCFLQQNDKTPTGFCCKFTSVSSQYKLRVVIAFVLSLVSVFLNLFSRSSKNNQCHLQKAFFPSKCMNGYFECSRPIDIYYDAEVYIFSALLILTCIVLFGAFIWTVQFPSSDTDKEFLFRMLKATGKTNGLSRLCYDGLSHLILLSTAADTTTSKDTRLN